MLTRQQPPPTCRYHLLSEVVPTCQLICTTPQDQHSELNLNISQIYRKRMVLPVHMPTLLGPYAVIRQGTFRNSSHIRWFDFKVPHLNCFGLSVLQSRNIYLATGCNVTLAITVSESPQAFSNTLLTTCWVPTLSDPYSYSGDPCM